MRPDPSCSTSAAAAFLAAAFIAAALATTAGAQTIQVGVIDPIVSFTDGTRSLLVSQIGYALPGVRDAFLMAPTRADGDMVTTFTIEDRAGAPVAGGTPEYAGEWVTAHFWRLDLTAIDRPGEYRVLAGNLVSHLFPVVPPSALYFQPHYQDMMFAQLRERAGYDALGGFIEAGNDIRTSESCSTLLLGLLDMLELHADRLTSAELDELDGFLRHGHDFLLSMQQPTGQYNTGWWMGSPILAASRPSHLRANYAILRLARHYRTTDPTFADEILAEARLAVGYSRLSVDIATSWSSFLIGRLRVEIELHLQTGEPETLAAARAIAAELRSRQVPAASPTPEGLYGIFEQQPGSGTWSRLNNHESIGLWAGDYDGLPLGGLLALARLYPGDPDASTWRALVEDLVYGFLREAAVRGPLGLVANGEYQGDLWWFSDLFHGMSMTYGLVAAELIRYGDFFGDPSLYDLAERQLLWIGGLNTGFDFATGAQPFSCITAKGYQWLYDGHGAYRGITGSIVNGLSATPEFRKEMPPGPELPYFLCQESFIAHTGGWLSATAGLLRARLGVGNTLRIVHSGIDLLHLTWQDVADATHYNAYRDTRADGPYATFTATAPSGVSGIPLPTPPGPLVLFRVTGTDGVREGPR